MVLHGPERSAVRRRDRSRWILAPRERIEGADLPLGLLLELSRADIGRRDAPGAARTATPPSAPALPVATLPPAGGLLMAAALASLGGLGWALGHGGGRLAFAGATGTFTELALAGAALVLGLAALRWCEASTLASRTSGDARLLRFHRGLPRLEKVAWRLGIPADACWAVVGLPAGLWAVAAGWQSVAPAPAAGLAAAGLVYLIPTLYPLRPGAGARLLEIATAVDDLPIRMRWSLVQRFLPVPTDVEAGGSRSLAVATLALAGWAGAGGAVLYRLAGAPPDGVTFPGVIWQVTATAALLGYALWLVVRTGDLLVDAVRLTGLVALEPLVPPEDLVRRWREDNPLIRQLPELRSAEWTWGLAPQGTLLTRQGSEKRDFYWLARGRVQVVTRSGAGDPLPAATLGGGAGIGEVSLLEGRPRTADVIAAEDCVVAGLEPSAYRRAADETTDERFRTVVEASQALGRSDAFWGLAADERSRWLAHGDPDLFSGGDEVVTAGEPGRWIGLVVRGSLDVERDGRVIAGLEPGQVFGEIAYFSDGHRTATLRAREPTTIWRWDRTWLDGAIDRAGLGPALRTLAEERSREGR